MRKIKQRHDHLIQLVNQLELQVFEPLYDQQHVDSGHWDYVAYDIDNFLNHMEEAYELLGSHEGKKFIDVGCGVGTKVHLASMYFDSYGIELHKPYVKAARKLNRPKKFFKYGRYEVQDKTQRIFEQDALTFDYSTYDVIYFFRPMNDDDMQKRLERRIYRQAKPGAIIVPIFRIGEVPQNVRHIRTPSKEIYVKTRNRRHAKNLQVKANSLFFPQ